MDMITDDNIIEKIKVIKSILTKKELPITSSSIANQFKISMLESSALLNDFILNEEGALDKYTIVFLIEQIEENGISIIILSNNDYNLESVLNSSKTIFFSTFAIMKKMNNSLDYGSFAIPNNIEYRYDLNTVKVNKLPTNNKIEKKPIEKGKEQKFNQEFNSKLVVNNHEDENMYQGFNPKRQETNDSKRKINDSSTLIQSKKVTKKNSNNNNNEISSPKKQITIIETKSNLEEQKEEFNDDDNDNEDVKMKDSTEVEIDIKKYDQESNNIPRQVLKRRKVKKTVQKVNKKGYLVTEDEWVEEEYWEEEKPIDKLKRNNQQYNAQLTQFNKKQKKLTNGQSSLFSFLNK